MAKTSKRAFRSMREFQDEMFPKSAALRNEESEREHPQDAGARLAEDALAKLRSRKARQKVVRAVGGGAS